MDRSIIGTQIIRLSTVDSTNNFAANGMKSGDLTDGTVILAEEQTAGRGQRGRSWESGMCQNLTLSIILYPPFLKIPQSFYLNIALSLGISWFLEKELQLSNAIKWPNDVFVQDKKIAGLLIETTMSREKVQSVIAGIGFNVNQTQFEAPYATSLKMLTGQDHDLDQVLETLLSHIETAYMMLLSQQWTTLKELYLSKLYLKDELHAFVLNGKRTNATILGIDDSGRLTIQTSEGKRSYDLHEVEYQL